MWRKSSFCNGAATCVEVAPLGDGSVGVRDSKDPDGACLVFTPEEWLAFTAGVRAGEFDPAALGADAGDGSDAKGAARASEAAVAREGAASVSL